MGFELRADVEYPVYLVQVHELQISASLALRSAVFELWAKFETSAPNDPNDFDCSEVKSIPELQ